jgi:hypothetical protein
MNLENYKKYSDDNCFILHKEYRNNNIKNNYFDNTDKTDNIILSKNGKCGFNKDDNKIYKCPPEQCCSNNECTFNLEQCGKIQKYIENKTIDNIDNIDNMDHIDNIDNIDHIDHIDNIDNMDTLDSINNIDNKLNIIHMSLLFVFIILLIYFVIIKKD